MKEYHNNPRILTDKKKEELERFMKEYGDLSGIVYNVDTDEIISGNQRSKIIDINSCDIEYIETFDSPTINGTLALGYITYNGEKYNFRKVSWSPEKAEEANIIANKAGGDWDWDMLREEFEVDLLLNSGFEDHEINWGDFEPDKPEPEIKPDVPEEEKRIIKLEYSFEEYQKVEKAIHDSGRSPEAILYDALFGYGI